MIVPEVKRPVEPECPSDGNVVTEDAAERQDQKPDSLIAATKAIKPEEFKSQDPSEYFLKVEAGEVGDEVSAHEVSAHEVSAHEVSAHEVSAHEVPAQKTDRPVKKDVEEEDPSYSGLHRDVYNMTTEHLNEFIEEVIFYLDEWKKVNSTRIKSGLYEFKELCLKLAHYERKVKGLENTRNKEKFERNKHKLLGVREAHAAYSERLLRYIEEVSDRAWKDLYPLLFHVFSFDLSYSAGRFKYISHLNLIIEDLKQVGVEHGLQQHGRLQELENKGLGEVYTGERGSLRGSLVMVKIGGSSSGSSR